MTTSFFYQHLTQACDVDLKRYERLYQHWPAARKVIGQELRYREQQRERRHQLHRYNKAA